jgi:excisionase family DNA binding protein
MITLGNIRVFDIKEVSKTFKVSVGTIRRYVRSGKLPGQRVGTKWYISEAGLNEFFLKGYVKPAKAKKPSGK